ncbi:MAG: hypothetical protein GXO99_02235 [Nitrospirae bacterium]|nr:hypothetical protein [Nitrospirota bacterium]
MENDQVLNEALKKRFFEELTDSEKHFFLKKAKELVYKEGYLVTEDLFYYCYFITLKERLRGTEQDIADGLLRYIRAEARKEIEDEISLYKSRLIKKETTQNNSSRLIE